MASKYYCSNVAGELEGLSEKLHNLSDKIDRLPSIDKYKLQTHIDELHIIMTELDDRLCEMVTSCSSVEMLDRKEPATRTGVSFSEVPKKNEFFDYEIGG
jgi:hypothetical protein